MTFQPSHFRDYVLCSTVLGVPPPFIIPFLCPTLPSTPSFLLFLKFFLSGAPDWKYFRSSLLHDISLKIMQVTLLALELALEEHPLGRDWKVVWQLHPGFSSRTDL